MNPAVASKTKGLGVKCVPLAFKSPKILKLNSNIAKAAHHHIKKRHQKVLIYQTLGRMLAAITEKLQVIHSHYLSVTSFK